MALISGKDEAGDVVKLHCHLCGNDWDYTGKHPFWATCPRCLRKVKVQQGEKK